MTTEDLAARVMEEGDWSREGPPQISLALILVILKIIFVVFECFQVLDDKTIQRVRKPGVLVRWKLWFTLRKVLAKENALDQLTPLYNALLTVGSGITYEELAAVVGQCKQDPIIYSQAVRYDIL